jgi:serine/threonine protein phosphatase PrpC
MTLNGKTAISFLPKCSLLQLQEGDLILAGCDGIFDFASVHNVIYDVLKNDWENPKLANLIADYAYNKKQSDDNITALVIRVSSKGGILTQTEEILTQPLKSSNSSTEEEI